MSEAFSGKEHLKIDNWVDGMQFRQLITPLGESFISLCDNIIDYYNVDPDRKIIGQGYSFIAGNYSSPFRFYHTLKHVQDMLIAFDEFKHILNIEMQYVVEMAIFWHDVIQLNNSECNEIDSGELAYDFLRKLNIPDNFCFLVMKSVVSTIHSEDTIYDDPYQKLIRDLDIIHFSKGEKYIFEVKELLWNEYKNIYPRNIFDAGNISILSIFNKNPFFLTEAIQDTYGKIALSSLQTYLRQAKDKTKQ